MVTSYDMIKHLEDSLDYAIAKAAADLHASRGATATNIGYLAGLEDARNILTGVIYQYGEMHTGRD